MSFAAWLGAFREAVVAMLATIATLLCVLALGPEPAPAILAVVLSLSLARSHLDRSTRERLEAAVALPIVGLLTVGVGVRPADWIDALLTCRQRAVALIDAGATPATVRVAVGKARKALREPATLLAALRDLSSALDRDATGGPAVSLSDP
jgi:hypothetical protein